MQLGAHLAGAAIEQSMLGAAHACANPLTAHYGLTHGIAVGLMLPHVIRLNASVASIWYSELTLCRSRRNGQADDPAERLASRVAELVRAAGVADRLSAHRIEAVRLPELAAEAATQWTGKFNPHPVDATTLLGVYRSAF
jgi:alcohol dehydrogenase